MQPKDYFILCMRKETWRYMHWIYAAFTVVDYSGIDDDTPYLLRRDKKRAFFIDEDGSTVYLTETFDEDNPVFNFLDGIVLKPGEYVGGNGSDIKTTYGNVIVSSYTSVLLNNKLPFLTGALGPEDIEDMIAPILIDDPEDDVYNPEEKSIYVKEYIDWADYTNLIGDSLCDVIVPTGSEKTVTHHPDLKRLKKELFEKYKDELSDPATLVKIQEEFIKLDKEYIGDGPETRFLTGKDYAIVRMRLFGMIGTVGAYQKPGKELLVMESLDEGIKMDNIDAFANGSRHGAASRGIETAFGGVVVKESYRGLQNTRIEFSDCGTKIGIRRLIEESNAKRLIGSYIFDAGKTVLLTADNVKSYIGKIVESRSPGTCKIRPNLCMYCYGKHNSVSENAAPQQGSEIGTQTMLLRMKAMHGKTASNAVFDKHKHMY